MKYESITVTIKRDVRHARYNVSQVKASFQVQLEEGEDKIAAFDEVHALCSDAVEEMTQKEIEVHATNATAQTLSTRKKVNQENI